MIVGLKMDAAFQQPQTSRSLLAQPGDPPPPAFSLLTAIRRPSQNASMTVPTRLALRATTEWK